jgi:hypothetical protein
MPWWGPGVGGQGPGEGSSFHSRRFREKLRAQRATIPRSPTPGPRPLFYGLWPPLSAPGRS